MKCRNIINGNIVFFGSQGVDEEGNKISANNYIEDDDAIVKGLTQRLSVLKGELWYNKNYGIPLIDKLNKTAMDARIIEMINDYPGTIRILSYTSRVIGKVYSLNVRILTKTGEVNFSL